MNDPNKSEDLLIEDLEKEYMELIGTGSRAAFDFALENSDKANYALQALGMTIVKEAGDAYEKLPLLARAPALSILTICARDCFLDVIEKEVAPMWAEQEYAKRTAEFEVMREERLYSEYPEIMNEVP
jgi:hypothetical protein